MIAYLTGPAQVKKDHLLVVVNGVGYQVFAGHNLLRQVQTAGKPEVALSIYTLVKEDRLELYGFASEEELELFKLVLNVSGVGPKIAMQLVDAGSISLINAVQEAKLAFFTSVPRVGKKLAQKIIIELKGKLGSLRELNLATLSAPEQDILDALMGLGFEENLARDIISDLDMQGLSIEAALKIAINQANQRSTR